MPAGLNVSTTDGSPLASADFAGRRRGGGVPDVVVHDVPRRRCRNCARRSPRCPRPRPGRWPCSPARRTTGRSTARNSTDWPGSCRTAARAKGGIAWQFGVRSYPAVLVVGGGVVRRAGKTASDVALVPRPDRVARPGRSGRRRASAGPRPGRRAPAPRTARWTGPARCPIGCRCARHRAGGTARRSPRPRRRAHPGRCSPRSARPTSGGTAACAPAPSHPAGCSARRWPPGCEPAAPAARGRPGRAPAGSPRTRRPGVRPSDSTTSSSDLRRGRRPSGRPGRACSAPAPAARR